MASKGRNMFQKNKTQETTEECHDRIGGRPRRTSAGEGDAQVSAALGHHLELDVLVSRAPGEPEVLVQLHQAPYSSGGGRGPLEQEGQEYREKRKVHPSWLCDCTISAQWTFGERVDGWDTLVPRGQVKEHHFLVLLTDPRQLICEMKKKNVLENISMAIHAAPLGIWTNRLRAIDDRPRIKIMNDLMEEATHWSLPDLFWSTIALALLREQVTGPTSLQSARRV
ncbi:hypothetical protein AAG570_004005 [Ranatra chinensis]|uniref:Uncharacterized protein n=1 Tax=Ranatra chinensis TaxID=642074 RepID=A0ABD0Y3V7_9HEMI